MKTTFKHLYTERKELKIQVSVLENLIKSEQNLIGTDKLLLEIKQCKKRIKEIEDTEIIF